MNRIDIDKMNNPNPNGVTDYSIENKSYLFEPNIKGADLWGRSRCRKFKSVSGILKGGLHKKYLVQVEIRRMRAALKIQKQMSELADSIREMKKILDSKMI